MCVEHRVCCSVLQCVAVCCSVLQCVAVCYRTHTVTDITECNVLECIAVYCCVLQRVAGVLQCVEDAHGEQIF